MNKEPEALNTITYYVTEIDGMKVNITYQENLKAHAVIEEALKFETNKTSEPLKEINLSLDVILSAVKNGVWFKVDEDIFHSPIKGIVYDEGDKKWKLITEQLLDLSYWSSIAASDNYGTVWALTKEELEQAK